MAWESMRIISTNDYFRGKFIQPVFNNLRSIYQPQQVLTRASDDTDTLGFVAITSSTFVNVHATWMRCRIIVDADPDLDDSFTVSVGRDIMIVVNCVAFGNASDVVGALTLSSDGTDVNGTNGLMEIDWLAQPSGQTLVYFMKDPTPGEHEIILRAKRIAGTTA